MNINKHMDIKYIGDKSKIIDLTNKRYYDVIPNADSFILARNIHSTAEEVLRYPEWYILDHVYNYFKTNDAFNELLMVELFKEFNLKCLEYQIAKDNNKIGIISKNFRKRGTSYYEYYSYPDESAFYAYKTLNEFEEYASRFINSDNLSTLIASLSRLLVVDFFSGQSDRTSCNLLFEERNELKLAPISDNGSIFNKDEMNISSSCIETLRFPNSPIVNIWEYNTLSLIVKNVEFRKYLIKCLDIDMNEVINRTVDKYCLKLYKYERNEILSYFDAKKKIIDNTLKLVKKEN